MTEKKSDKCGSISIRAAGLIVSFFTATGPRKTKKAKDTKKWGQFSIKEIKKDQRGRLMSEYCSFLVLWVFMS